MAYTVAGVVAECERSILLMLCKNPYIKMPTGISRIDTIVDRDARMMSTPFPCGQCLPCRINRSRLWHHRILLESMAHDENSFVTLTYDEENLPKDRSLNPKHLTDFLKRYRKKIFPKKIRYFAVGEYGEKSERPHYHLMVFGDDDEHRIDSSWDLGFTYCGSITNNSASYIAKYTIKALTKEGDKRLEGKKPEFMRCSKMDGGLGIETIREIGENLKTKKYGRDRVIRELVQAKKKLPLGRYLTEKLLQFAEFDEEIKEAELWAYQEEVFSKHLNAGEIFKDNVVNENEPRRRALEHNHKVFPKRRPL